MVVTLVSIRKSGGGITPTTLVVAASDSSPLSKSRADYVCSGTDDLDYITTTIIPLLPSVGGRIVLLEGTYYISSDNKPLVINNKQNITIEGQGGSTQFKLKTTTLNSNFINITGGSTYTTIRNITIVGSTSSNSGHGIYVSNAQNTMIENCSIINIKQYGIYLQYSTTVRTTITKCYFNNMVRGISIAGAQYIKIKNNFFTTFTNYAIYSQWDVTYPFYIVIMGNIIYNSGTTGIYLDYTTHVSINGNFLFTNPTGIFLSQTSAGTISGNYVSTGAVGIQTTSGSPIVGNLITGQTSYGIKTGTSPVVGNYVSSCNVGISVYLWSSTTRSIVSGNEIESSTTRGIEIYSHTANIVGNTIYGGCSEAGIYAQGYWHKISDNYVEVVNGHGIYLHSYSGGGVSPVHYASVLNNVVIDSSQGTDNTYDAVYLHGYNTDSTYNMIMNNYTINTGGTKQYRYALNLSSSYVKYAKIRNNHFIAGKTGTINDNGVQTLYYNYDTVITKDSNYTIRYQDDVIVHTDSNPHTYTLPAAIGTGRRYYVKNLGSANLTLAANGTDTIDGSSSQTISSNGYMQVVDYAQGMWIIV